MNGARGVGKGHARERVACGRKGRAAEGGPGLQARHGEAVRREIGARAATVRHAGRGFGPRQEPAAASRAGARSAWAAGVGGRFPGRFVANRGHLQHARTRKNPLTVTPQRLAGFAYKLLSVSPWLRRRPCAARARVIAFPKPKKPRRGAAAAPGVYAPGRWAGACHVGVGVPARVRLGAGAGI